MSNEIKVSPINISDGRGKAGLAAFVDLAYRLNKRDPNWVPPLRQDVFELFNPKKNPFFEHARVQPMLATRDGKIVGRISAHIDELALAQPTEQGMGPGTGNWGMLEAEDRHVAAALIKAAEDWLVGQGMTRSLGPLSLSVWDEPGMLVKGFRHPPMVMMGHNKSEYETWVLEQGYKLAKTLNCYELEIKKEWPPLIKRVIESGKRNTRITVRNVDKNRFDEEAARILDILNDAWSDNWGFVPITDAEVQYIQKKLYPLIREDLVQIAEVDGEPMAFMMTLPDINEVTSTLNGSLYPFGWAALLMWLRKCRCNGLRVPLMGVRKELQSSRMASQLAFMMIDKIRDAAVRNYGGKRGEIGWILENNQGMVAIAEALKCDINRQYAIFEKPLS